MERLHMLRELRPLRGCGLKLLRHLRVLSVKVCSLGFAFEGTQSVPLRRFFWKIAPATLLPAAALLYFFAALAAIFEKFLPGAPMSAPARAFFAAALFDMTFPFAIQSLQSHKIILYVHSQVNEPRVNVLPLKRGFRFVTGHFQSPQGNQFCEHHAGLVVGDTTNPVHPHHPRGLHHSLQHIIVGARVPGPPFLPDEAEKLTVRPWAGHTHRPP